MEDQDTSEPREDSAPREDDRNEEVPDSPAPDPEEGKQDAEDVPTAD